ncbi:MAG: DUF3237 domain-containing protein [Candidatus Dormibacteraeota bacterium]|nr:DUF3237 domain-containing protein [Candidatus Dormibacteraeota bacterium]
MKLTPLCELEFQYTWTDFVDLGAGGQYIGILDGVATGDRLKGTLKLVNVPPKRPDNVNCPTIRGILTTDDGGKIYLEMNGIALLRQEDKARVFTTSLSLRSGDARYAWVNTVFGVVEGVLNTTTDMARARAFACANDIEVVWKEAETGNEEPPGQSRRSAVRF